MMVRRLVLLPFVVASAACGSGTPDSGAAEGSKETSSMHTGSSSHVSVSASGGGTATARTESNVNGAREVKEKTELYSFEYSYPAPAGSIPQLKAILDTRMDKEKSQFASEARDAKRSAEKDGFPYREYEAVTAWKVVTDLPGWLSLSAEFYAFTGGAHGNHGYDALLWDRKANVMRDPISLFLSPRVLNAAVTKDFCAALNRERAKKRGEPVKPGSTDPFDECISIEDTTVILGSSNGKTFDRVGFLIGPYAAGPYAEGDYEITLPVDKAILAVVKPEYRESFSEGR